MARESEGPIRFVDLCAGLGGFHEGIVRAAKDFPNLNLECVLVSEIDPALRELYVSNFPELGDTYRRTFPPDRVADALAVTKDAEHAEALDIYEGAVLKRVHGDLEALVDLESESLRCWPGSDDKILPPHDLLCAGFPCQPFSKSGAQRGFADLRGTVFHLIAVILKHHRPELVFLENVGNFERHDGGNTWATVKATLEELGYEVAATCHKASGGPDCHGLLSPHHLGFPHHRERFFILAQQRGTGLAQPLPGRWPFPMRPSTVGERKRVAREAEAHLKRILVSGTRHSSTAELARAQLGEDNSTCISHWERFLELLREADETEGRPWFREHMPSFPIWGYELDPWQWYPIERNPSGLLKHPERLDRMRVTRLREAAQEVADRSGGLVKLMDYPPSGERAFLESLPMPDEDVDKWVDTLPGYAVKRTRWPRWKQRFLQQNRDWALEIWSRFEPGQLREWLDRLVTEVPAPSNQKLEWNCKGEHLRLDNLILQFRPSGLRVKRFGHVPALVAMTTTQIPIVPQASAKGESGGTGGARRTSHRHLLASEALQLQGFPPDWRHPSSREGAFKAFGNAVHCDVVAAVFKHWLGEAQVDPQQLGLALASAGGSQQAD